MTRLLATRRDALDLQALLDGERPSSAAARARLQPLAALAGSLAPREVAPGAEFVAGLRARLLAEAADRPVTGVPAQRSHPRTRKVRRGVAVVTALGLLGGAGAALASTRALPGDELYGLKRGIEHVQLSLAHGDVGRGSELLDQAEARLGEAQALAAGENSTSPETLTRLSSTLQQMATADEQAVTDLTRAYDETGDASVLTLLDRHLTAQLSGLADLTSVVAPQVRRQAADLADRLGRLDTAVRALLGGPALADAASVAAAPSWGEGLVLDARSPAPCGSARRATSPEPPEPPPAARPASRACSARCRPAAADRAGRPAAATR